MSSFVVRPSNSDKDAFKVKVTAASLLGLRLKPGDTCEIHGPTESNDGRRKLAIVWDASGQGLKDTVVQTSKLLQETYGLKLGDKITITSSPLRIEESELVTLQCDTSALNDDQVKFWERHAQYAIAGVDEFVAISQKLSFRVGLEKIDLRVKDVGGAGSWVAKVSKSTTFRITDSVDTNVATSDVDFQPTKLGGLERQVSHLRSVVRRLCRTEYQPPSESYSPKQGVLIYGAKGTGKSVFIQSLVDSGWPTVVRWTPATKLSTTNETRLIVVESGYLSRRSGENSSPTSATTNALISLFEQIKNTRTLVVAETSHPNDIDQSLRSVGRFKIEIELPIPSALQRHEILLAIRGRDKMPDDQLLQTMAERTHGYVGADLYDLFCNMLELAMDRQNSNDDITGIKSTDRHSHSSAINDTTTSPLTKDHRYSLTISLNDFEQALSETRPSALQEIFLETPNVHWTDIGGQQEIKRTLQNAVERPLKHAARMAELGLTPKKGVLLYGPPGCSKTLLVKALATEAKLNFLAVKGAELISMYVGESERAIREVFRKARAASPSIIFFDEIDSIASRGRSGGDLNVLTTLLNEMDGFEELKNVMVVAATNKPMAIDPALMRPGRFDNVVYIGPPDGEARKEIFEKRLGKIHYRPDVTVEVDAARFSEMTKGFSGAEVVGILQTAGELAFDGNDTHMVSSDVEEAIKKTPKSITAEMLEDFEKWNETRRA